jgi:hypothetical protein
MASIFINETAYDASCVTVKVDGIVALPGVQSVTLGSGLQMGKLLFQVGSIKPVKRTRGRFSGDGFEIKFLMEQAQAYMEYLQNAAGGILGPEGIAGVNHNMVISLELVPNSALVTTITLESCHAFGPDIQGIDSPDSSEAMTATFKLQPMNRSIQLPNGKIFKDAYDVNVQSAILG